MQKGFIEKLAGCVEHSETLHHALLDARKSKLNTCVSWLDLANAYGSVRHSMILFTLEWYWVPAEFAEIVYQYYEGLCATVLVGNELTWSVSGMHAVHDAVRYSLQHCLPTCISAAS